MDRAQALAHRNRRLRRHLCELAALATLPGRWSQGTAAELAAWLAEVLVKVLRAEAAGVRLRDADGARPLEAFAHGPRGRAPAHEAALGRVLAAWLEGRAGTATSSASSVAVTDEGEGGRIAIAPIGGGCEFGALAAAGTRPDFPDEGERLLLGAAAGQAAAVLQHQRDQTSRALLSAIVESSNDAIVSKTLDGVVTSWNAAAERLFGFSAGEAVGRPITALIIPPDRLDEEQSILTRVRRGERIWPYETVRRRKDGSPVEVSLTISPIRDGSGRIVGASKLAQDISERQNAARRRDAFLAMLAHEMRNPLAPIRSAVQVLRGKGPLAPDLQWAVEVIERQVEQLARLVDDLLDVSRLTRDAIGLRKETVDLATVVGSAVDASRPLCEQRRHQLTVTLPAEPLRLEADPVRLAQILANLLNNSAKYTEPGGRIWLSAEREGEWAVIRVRDTGIGIGADLLPRVFDMFSQGERAAAHAQGGLGLGLTLVKRLAELHGGNVSAYSAGSDLGAEFVVRLPLGAVGAAPAGARVAAPAAGVGRCRILVVDDNADAVESLSILLGMRGHEVHTASDGREAVRLAGSLALDVVVLDIGLPGMDGFEAARRIRRLPGGAELVLIALTGWGQEDDRRRSREAGFDHHLVKPVDIDALERFIARRVPCAVPRAADA